jgi:electron transfer flavoprotein alpha/beta subunit
MRIVVILGRVLDPSGIVVNRRRGRIFVNWEEYMLQPADRCALEAALCIKDTTGAEVVALPRGPLPDNDVLRQALATGADRAVYLAGEGFAEADDAAMAGVLAAAVERLGGADLVLIGASTLDTGQGQLGPRLAEALGWPQILGAWAVEAADGRVQAVVQASGGQEEETRFFGKNLVSVEADLPALVTVLPGTLKPRYPDGVRLINVYRGVGDLAEALEQWNVADLVAADAIKPLLERRGQDFPPERERGTRASGTPGEMAQVVAGALRQRVGG